MDTKIMKPFLRWAGGKQYLLHHLLRFIPENYREVRYFEPFFGAGSLFFAVSPRKAILSDLNSHLIDCYNIVRDYPKKLYYYLLRHKKNNSKKYYYEIRNQFNKYLGQNTIAQASRFIYLNRACFNGIFRVNTFGYFNVPYDSNKTLVFPSLSELYQFSGVLKNVLLITCSYEKILPKTRTGDFIYIDPPYPPLNGTSYFTHYTKDRFPISDQIKVYLFAEKLLKKGCNVLITNADTDEIRKLYRNWHIFPVEATRFISCKSKRHKVGEVIMTNYDL